MSSEGLKFTKAYTSKLTRAQQTLKISMEASGQAPSTVEDYRLNERHYGALQGLDKQQVSSNECFTHTLSPCKGSRGRRSSHARAPPPKITQTVDKFGKDQVLIWRRSYDIPPPECDSDSPEWPGNDPAYSDVEPSLLPFSESLKTTAERFMPLWTDVIIPEIKSGQQLIIAAHGNTLRALVMHLDSIPTDVITGLNIPTGVPLVYELDEDMKPVKSEMAIEPLSGRYLGDQEEIMKRIGAVAAQTK